MLATCAWVMRTSIAALILTTPARSESLWLASHVPGQASSAGNGPAASTGSFSADGRFLVFSSQASDLVAGGLDSNGDNDVFLWDRFSGALSLVSHVPGDPLTAGNGPSTAVGRSAISADGRFVVFMSSATNLFPGGVDTNGARDVFLWDRLTDSTLLVSHAAGAAEVAANAATVPYAISSDGNFVALMSEASNLVAGVSDMNGLRDVFLWSRLANNSMLVSHSGSSATTTANGESRAPKVSNDGRVVAFPSKATNLLEAGTDLNGGNDVFLWERDSNLVVLVSHAAGTPTVSANGVSSVMLGEPVLSASGSHVVFDSLATDLVAGMTDTNGSPDVFSWESSSGVSRLVSHRAGESLRSANGVSYPDPDATSQGGELTAFDSTASDLVLGGTDSNGTWDGYVWHAASNSIELVTHVPGSPASAGNAASGIYHLSADGSVAIVGSRATDLVAGGTDANSGDDVFRWDRVSGELLLVSHSAASATTAGNASSWGAAISPDGRFSHFRSEATDLLSGALPGTTQAFVWCEAGCELIHFGLFESGDFAGWSAVVP